MNRIFLIISCLAILAACNNNQPNKADSSIINNPITASDTAINSKDAPVMTFEENIHDFGRLIDGEVVTYKFKFKNTGNSPLLISAASASCGCTVPSYPKEPIAPGKEGAIDVQFNSSGKVGAFDKNVTIVSNTIPNQTILAIKGLVQEKK